MYATDFIFDGQSLSDFGLVLCDFDGSSSLHTDEAGVPLTFRTISRSRGEKFSLVNSLYDKALEFSFDICKDPCVSNNDAEISDAEYLRLSRWLLHKQYKELQFINEKHSIQRHYRVVINISKLSVDDILVGLRLIVTTDKPYAYGDTVTISNTFSDSGTWEVLDRSVLEWITAPYLVITCAGSGTLRLSNSLTGSVMQINNCTTGEILTIDGENQILTTSKNSHENIWNDFNFEFLTIGNTKTNSKNIIEASMPCEVVMTYSPVLRDAP